ncbi:MAG: tetratricopeptide repeat protein [Verrucomicrobia bacterium]|nr:tetratricopeptide repeat protein [Verrucomicrobiota bacterium]
MKHVSLLLCVACLALASPSAQAAAADELYVKVFNTVLQGDSLLDAGQGKQALEKYLAAHEELKKLQAAYKTWEPKLVTFRMGYLDEQIKKLSIQFPGTTAPKPIIPTSQTGDEAGSEKLTGLEKQVRDLNNELVRARAESSGAQQKLKEALAARPKDVDPAELVKAQKKARDLQKAADLKQIEVEDLAKRVATITKERDEFQKRVAVLNDKAEVPVLKKENSALKLRVDELTKLTVSNKSEELARLLASAKAELKAEQDRVSALAKANQKMEAILTDPNNATGITTEQVKALEKKNKDLESSVKALEAQVQKGTADGSKLRQMEKEREDLQKQLNELQKQLNEKKKVSSNATEKLGQDLAAAQARVAALEARRTPYSAEELALLKGSSAPVAAPAPVAKSAKKNSADLPPGAASVALEAQRAYAAQRFGEAEKKYLEVLSLDPANVYTLANLGAAQMELNKLPEAESHLKRALSLDPDDAFSLSLLGLLKFRQQKSDDAFDALSRAAKLDPDNAQTQNYLGLVLSMKGQREAAEAAFRKAIQIAPGYAVAHYNLAVYYATQNPPTRELARWHYQKALTVGHPKSDELEKLLARN